MMLRMCPTSDFTQTDTDSFTVYNSQEANGERYGSESTGFCEADGSCMYWKTPPNNGLANMPAPSSARVIDTDYTSYAIHY